MEFVYNERTQDCKCLFKYKLAFTLKHRLATSRLRNARQGKRGTKSRVDLFRLRNIEFNLHTVGAKKLGVTIICHSRALIPARYAKLPSNSGFEAKYLFRIDKYHTSAIVKSIPYQYSFIMLKFQHSRTKPDEIRFYLLYLAQVLLSK